MHRVIPNTTIFVVHVPSSQTRSPVTYIDHCLSHSFYSVSQAVLHMLEGATIQYVSPPLPQQKALHMIRYIENNCTQFRITGHFYNVQSDLMVALLQQLYR